MPRICQREGCGKRLLDDEGNPEYNNNRRFCGDECLKLDKQERLEAQRAIGRRLGQCQLCGRKLP